MDLKWHEAVESALLHDKRNDIRSRLTASHDLDCYVTLVHFTLGASTTCVPDTSGGQSGKELDCDR